jgi:hypothetical protein
MNLFHHPNTCTLFWKTRSEWFKECDLIQDDIMNGVVLLKTTYQNPPRVFAVCHSCWCPNETRPIVTERSQRTTSYLFSRQHGEYHETCQKCQRHPKRVAPVKPNAPPQSIDRSHFCTDYLFCPNEAQYLFADLQSKKTKTEREGGKRAFAATCLNACDRMRVVQQNNLDSIG